MGHTGQHAIAYGKHLAAFRTAKRVAEPDDTLEAYLLRTLPGVWCKAYARMPGRRVDIVQVSDEYQFLFDLGCERVIAAFGLSKYNAGARDAKRMSEFLGAAKSQKDLDALEKAAPSPAAAKRRRHLAGLSFRERFFETHGERYDRGHFMSHRQGGQLDINLFPQLAHVNQGHSNEGKVYRSMETACAARRDTFCFSRPIYDDDTWVPVRLEYGLLQSDRTLMVQVFRTADPTRCAALKDREMTMRTSCSCSSPPCCRRGERHRGGGSGLRLAALRIAPARSPLAR